MNGFVPRMSWFKQKLIRINPSLSAVYVVASVFLLLPWPLVVKTGAVLALLDVSQYHHFSL